MIVYDSIRTNYSVFTLDLDLNADITFLRGDSSTGKSFLYKMLANMSLIDYDKMKCFNYLSVGYESTILSLEGKLVVLDNEESLLTDNLKEFINKKTNQYLLIGRISDDIYAPVSSKKILIFKDNIFTFENEVKL